MRPFRKLAVVLVIIALVEVLGILSINTYTDELEEARTRLEEALRVNEELREELENAQTY